MLKFPGDNFIFLETNRFDKDNQRSFLFFDPVKIVECYSIENIKRCLLELEGFISEGYYIAGFISYEAGYAFEEVLKDNKKKASFPLLWFGAYKRPVIFRHTEKLDILNKGSANYSVSNLRSNISRNEYIRNVRRIRDFIKKGDTYQVNYTFKYKFDFNGSLHGFYNCLKGNQSVSYSSLIKTPEFSIVSLSPELFFRKKGDILEVRPMKGTIDRGRMVEEDVRNANILKNSIKNRSENVMIVDLLRNDLGRIAETGTVKTEKLFKVEKYETLLQMISIVRAKLKKETSLYGLFKAIFPSGSVTGAPKIRTMDIINSIEKESRHIYTGGIGFFSPQGEAVFNVAIRTVLINNKTKKAEMGVGSGIVYDSDPANEFEECRLKANFITVNKKDFQLIETMLWQPRKGYFLLRSHLDRLLSSAEYFNFRCNKEYIIKNLKGLETRLDKNNYYRIRLLLDRYGKIKLSHNKITERLGPKKVRFSDKKVCSKDVSLFHKTTNRNLYDKEYKRWNKKGYFDVIFLNEKNQVTEGAISNIIIKKGKVYFTPPVECGLLNGVYRRYLFKNGFPVKEKILYKKDIEDADEVYMANSVRKLAKVIYEKT